MNADLKHSLGSSLLWGGVVLAAAGVLFILPHQPLVGLLCLLAALPLSGTGAWLKKKYCPRRRADACTPPGPSDKETDPNRSA